MSAAAKPTDLVMDGVPVNGRPARKTEYFVKQEYRGGPVRRGEHPPFLIDPATTYGPKTRQAALDWVDRYGDQFPDRTFVVVQVDTMTRQRIITEGDTA